MTPQECDAFAAWAKPRIAQAVKFVQRRKRGLPTDRWAASEYEMHMVAEGIEALLIEADALTKFAEAAMEMPDANAPAE